MQLSKYFTLEDLTTTNQDVDNTPDTFAMGKLRELAVVLDLIYDQIGPFRVTSGYRSSAVNEKIGGSTNSYHSRGIAADILPYNDSAKTFFEKILRSPLFNSLGEVIDEANEKGVVHVSLPTPEKRSVAMWLENGNYLRYSADDVNRIKRGEAPAKNNSSIDTANVYGSEGDLSMTTIALAGVATFAVVMVGIISARQSGKTS